MFIKQPVITVGVMLLSATSFNAYANLITYNPNGVELVYSSVSNLTWTQDANLLGTMMNDQGYSTVVNATINASPVVSDIPNSLNPSGLYTVTAADFSSNVSEYGHANWWGASAFINYLNSTNYAGSD